MANSFQVPDDVLESTRQEILKLDGVQGLGESLWNDRPALKAFFSDEASLKRANLPAEISGIPVIGVTSGSFKKQ